MTQWRPALPAALALLMAAIAYRPLLRFEPERGLGATSDLVFQAATTPPMAIVALTLWLLYRRWPLLRAGEPPRSAAVSTALLSVAVLVFAWCTHTGATALLGLPLALTTLALGHALAGREGVRAVMVPALVLLFVIPLPPPLFNEIIFRLQLATAVSVGWALDALGEAVTVRGIQIVRPAQSFVVIEGCSGLRSMEILTLLALLIVDVFDARGWRAWLVVTAALPLAFLLNVLRVWITVEAGGDGAAVDHSLQGFAVLGAGVMSLYALARLICERGAGIRARPAAESRSAPRRAPLYGVVVALVVCAFLSLVLPVWLPPSGAPLAPLPRVGVRVGAWNSERLRNRPEFIERVHFYNNVHRRYRDSAEEHVDLFVGVDDHLELDRAAWSPKTALPGPDYRLEAREPLILDEGRVVGERLLLRSGVKRYLVYHWREGTEGLGTEILRSATALDRSPWRRERPLLVVRLVTETLPGDPEQQRADLRLRGFYELIRDSFAPLRQLDPG